MNYLNNYFRVLSNIFTDAVGSRSSKILNKTDLYVSQNNDKVLRLAFKAGKVLSFCRNYNRHFMPAGN